MYAIFLVVSMVVMSSSYDETLEYLDCAMSSTPSNYKSVHDNRFHGDEDHDPRSDLSQWGGGGGDDGGDPPDIPMYTPTTLQAPRGHKMMKEICPRGNNKVDISLYHDKCLLFMLELY